ncbi:MAG: hypothetical protein RL662_546 [Bacteroidota bacterium]|jgi:putative endonuclease
MAKHNDLGKQGEDLAVQHLLQKACCIVERNAKYGKCEIDIIAATSEYLLFVEVKTRSTLQWGNPEEAVSATKIRRMVEAADAYLDVHDTEKPVRFDVIAIVIKDAVVEITHIEDAFYAPLN